MVNSGFGDPSKTNMASAQGSLAQSTDVLKKEDFTEYEDPGRAWIDLKMAFKSGDPAKVREVLAVAKASHWTHELWSEATAPPSDDEEQDESGGEMWEEDFDCGHAQCKGAGACLLEEEEEPWEE